MELNNKQTKTLAFLLSAFSIVSAFFSVFDLPLVLQIAIFSSTIIAGVVAFILFRKVKGHEIAAEALVKAMDEIPKSESFHARTIANEAELKQAWKLDQEAFPGTSFDFSLLSAMWHAYPKGLTGLFNDDGETIGVFGIWPLKKKLFTEIFDGKATEYDITPQTIDKHGRKYWYAGGIIVSSKYRATIAVKTLITEALATWYEDVLAEPKVSVFAGAYSKDGEVMLKRFGFLKVDNKLSEAPIFVIIDVTPKDIHRIFSRVFGIAYARLFSIGIEPKLSLPSQ